MHTCVQVSGEEEDEGEDEEKKIKEKKKKGGGMMHQLIYVTLISNKGCFILDVYWTVHHCNN